MRTILQEKLHSYIVTNNPELMLSLQGSFSMTRYLDEKLKSIQPFLDTLAAEGKPQYIIEELAMIELTKEVRPSKFNYIKEILETEFEATYNRFRDSGVLTYEIVNMIAVCKPVFDEMRFSEDGAEERKLRYAIIGTIQEYLEKK